MKAGFANAEGKQAPLEPPRELQVQRDMQAPELHTA
eukprot:CAMPEP_0195089534 /NCGR_PEP_ID=MMETSP0448-20130528/28795_1 /TAXON_ID=66468 /ORGANISM="Heterocapsa triquestra, Strain CCMP 448" /LENGTH=35 /DNA_ID= /DNA_START= /DNA_END= /DNA_ORIENTATION=